MDGLDVKTWMMRAPRRRPPKSLAAPPLLLLFALLQLAAWPPAATAAPPKEQQHRQHFKQLEACEPCVAAGFGWSAKRGRGGGFTNRECPAATALAAGSQSIRRMTAAELAADSWFAAGKAPFVLLPGKFIPRGRSTVGREALPAVRYKLRDTPA